VSDEKQEEGQDLRSKLTALGFTPEQDKTEGCRQVGLVGGVRKPSAETGERKAQGPSADSSEITSSDTRTARSKLAGGFNDETEECLVRGEYGFLAIGERLSVRLFEDDGIIPTDLPEFTEEENEGSFFLKRSQVQELVSRLRKQR
jgi:hypothetical protein